MSTSFTVRVAELARELRAAPDPATTLQSIVDACVQLFPECAGAGITLADKNGEVRTSATSSELHAQLDELEKEMGEGPCLDSVWQEKAILVHDLSSEQRWTRLAPRAVETFGIRSMVCVQLYTAAGPLGSLSLSSREAGAFTESDIEEVMALGAHAAAAIAASENISHLEGALQSRTMIGQATGLVMAKYGLDSEAAFKVILRLSSEQNRKVAVLAREMVDDWDRTKEL